MKDSDHDMVIIPPGAEVRKKFFFYLSVKLRQSKLYILFVDSFSVYYTLKGLLFF